MAPDAWAMDLFLMRHGAAHSEQEDPARPLTPRGREEVDRVARAAARQGLGPRAIRHSGKLRAQQTAEIVAARLASTPAISPLPGLAPEADPVPLAKALGEEAGPLLLVGHLPNLSRLLSLLVVGDPARGLVAFPPAGLVGLAREADGWRLALILTPDLLPEP